MITVALLLFWVIVTYSSYAPWEPRILKNGPWSAFCVVMLYITITSGFMSIVLHIGPIAFHVGRWMAQHSDWLF